MYISNMTHFLDEDGNISKAGPVEARELASFLGLVIDAYTSYYTNDRQEIPCFNEICTGVITTGRSILTDEILWGCPECGIDGRISEWRGTKWENKDTPRLESPDNEKLAQEWFTKLTSELKFPIQVTPEDPILEDFPGIYTWKLTRITDCVEMFGLIVDVVSEVGEYSFPFCEFSVTDKESTNYKLIEEFLDWWYTKDDIDY